MKDVRIIVCALLACLPLFSALTADDPDHKAVPIVDFSAWSVQSDGKLVDRTGNASIIPGKTMQDGQGPFDSKSLAFDGLKTSVGTLDLSKIAEKLDGFDYSFSCWIRGTEQDQKDQPRLSGNSPCAGLGLKRFGNTEALFQMPVTGPGGSDIVKKIDVSEGEWNHIAFIFSLHKRIAILFVNGYPVLHRQGSGFFYPLKQNRSGKYEIGAFKGEIAELKIWDCAVPQEQFLRMQIPEKTIRIHQDQIRKHLEEAENLPGAKTMADSLMHELKVFTEKKDIALDDYRAFLIRLRQFRLLVPYVRAFRTATFKDAPFALAEAKSTSPHIRTPDKFPQDVFASQELNVTAARDEYTETTFFVFPYKDLEKIEFELTDLKNGRSVIPRSELEIKFVQCWMQPPWNSYFNGGEMYVPGLLLNDPELLRVDEREKINYLRINYPTGTQYENIMIPGSVLKHPPFCWAFEPVWDADQLLPLPCKFGRNRQIWVDIHVPEDAKAGIYTGRIKLKADGRDAGYIPLNVRVLPFVLPVPMTQFDRKLVYTQRLPWGKQISSARNDLKNQKLAEECAWNHLMNLKKHGIITVEITLTDDDLSGKQQDFLKMLEFMKKAKLPLRIIDPGSGTHNLFPPGSRRQWEDISDEEVAEDIARMDRKAQAVMEFLDKHVGSHEYAYFYGTDEAQSPDSLRIQAPYRHHFFRRGMRTHSSGWEDNYRNLPSYETYHDTAAYVSRSNADRWHAIGCEITAYAYPFIGPDNPDLMRRNHGLYMYRSNYDGWSELAYDSDRYHTWNHRFGYDTTYRPFRFIVATMKGPIINTVAFCGMRAGQNDVRYATMMHQLADECFASGKLENILAARSVLLWFRNLKFPVPDDLDRTRAGMTARILTLMKQLGKPMD